MARKLWNAGPHCGGEAMEERIGDNLVRMMYMKKHTGWLVVGLIIDQDPNSLTYGLGSINFEGFSPNKEEAAEKVRNQIRQYLAAQ